MTGKTSGSLDTSRRATHRQHRPLVLWDPVGSTEHAAQLHAVLGCEFTEVSGLPQAVEQLRQSAPAVVMVVFPARPSNLQLQQVEQLISEHHDCVWIALLHDRDACQGAALELISRSFFDFHHLPIEPGRLEVILGHAHGMLALQQQNPIPARLSGDEVPLLLGDSPSIRRLKKQLLRLTDSRHTVLVYGESGTGKELVCQALHQLSARRSMPFEAINCAALPSTLIQSELFGHEKGAFTDAHQRKIGRFEACDGGTLFLDEIGDMPLEQQTNLLRTLEYGSLRRIGGTRDITVDVRIIAATNCDLERAVAERRFRQDLYYRLNVVRLDMPPLRERGADIELLARHFHQQLHQAAARGPKNFSRAALSALRNHSWPGNVRELINRVQQALLLAEGKLIQPCDLGLEKRHTSRLPVSLKAAREHAERQAIENTLYQHGNNISQAARALQISRITLYRLMTKYRIEIK